MSCLHTTRSRDPSVDDPDPRIFVYVASGVGAQWVSSLRPYILRCLRSVRGVGRRIFVDGFKINSGPQGRMDRGPSSHSSGEEPSKFPWYGSLWNDGCPDSDSPGSPSYTGSDSFPDVTKGSPLRTTSQSPSPLASDPTSTLS